MNKLSENIWQICQKRQMNANRWQTRDDSKYQLKSIRNESVKVIAKPSQTKLTIEANNIFKFIANKVAWYVLVLAIVYRNIACHRCFKLQCIFWQSAPLCRNIMRLMQRIHTHTHLAYVSAIALSFSHTATIPIEMFQNIYTLIAAMYASHPCYVCIVRVCSAKWQ